MENAAEDVTLTGNYFCTADAGISISMPQPKTLRRLSITENTFFRLGHWLRWNATQAEGQDIEIARNLVLEAEGVQFPGDADLPRFASWFRDNVWELPELQTMTDRAEAGQLATLQTHVNMASRDSTHPDFLQTADSTLPGAPGGRPSLRNPTRGSEQRPPRSAP